MSNSENKKDPLLNSEAPFDLEKLLAADPNRLSRFIHKNPEAGEGTEGGTQEVAMPYALALAALRDAKGLSLSYTPAHSAQAVQHMSLSAQQNLGIEAVNGLQMNGPNPGGSTLPMGSSDDSFFNKKK